MAVGRMRNERPAFPHGNMWGHRPHKEYAAIGDPQCYGQPAVLEGIETVFGKREQHVFAAAVNRHMRLCRVYPYVPVRTRQRAGAPAGSKTAAAKSRFCKNFFAYFLFFLPKCISIALFL